MRKILMVTTMFMFIAAMTNLCSAKERDIRWVYSTDTTRYSVSMDVIKYPSDHEIELVVIMYHPESNQTAVMPTYINTMTHTYQFLGGTIIEPDNSTYDLPESAPAKYKPRSPIDRIVLFVQENDTRVRGSKT